MSWDTYPTTRVAYHEHRCQRPMSSVGVQPRRPRDPLIAAARDLVAAGATPTVEDAAAAASISRSTAYRYFPNERALLLAAHPEISTTSMLPANPPEDPASRLDAVVANFSELILDTAAQQRT